MTDRLPVVPVRCVLFDWGDTLMLDDPAREGPMAYWPKVKALDGAAGTLRRIKPGRMLAVATGAEVSTEAEIHAALARVGLDVWFDAVFCFQNTALRKPEPAFYRHALEKMGVRPEEAVMVGDHFEKDVEAAGRVGMRAVWFNSRSAEERNSSTVRTIHSLLELPELLDRGW